MSAHPPQALVVDASVTLKWFLAEPGSAIDLSLLRRTDRERIDLHAPAHWLAEVANALWVRTRGRDAGLDPEEVRAHLAILEDADVRQHALAPVVDLAFDIAATCEVTMYDALYVATAVRLDLPFVTADTRLIAKLEGTAWSGHAFALDRLS